MISRKLEAAGIPVVQVCNMIPVAEAVGVNRKWVSSSIKYPLGFPEMDPELEKEERIRKTREVLEVLTK